MINNGIGEMQMLPFDFWHLYTFAEFSTKAYFFFKNRDTDFKDRWEQTRQIKHMLAVVNGNKVTPEEIMPFTWDKERVYKPIKPISKEEAEKIFKSYGIKKN